MAESPDSIAAEKPEAPHLEGGAYDVIRSRLDKQAAELRTRLDQLNTARQEVFGAVEPKLIANERITTHNNCIPRDMVALPGDTFLFAYNVHMGLKSQVELSDVFAVYSFADDNTFHEQPLTLIENEEFKVDFAYLYRYYKETTFVKFMILGPHLFMAFRISNEVTDIKTFKWLIDGEQLTYLGNRFEHEFQYPRQHGFEWTRAHRDMHRSGSYPHVSIEDRLFVETTHGDLTIKVEDNTDSGEGIYTEPVEHSDQTLDDADIFYASLGNLILLKIKPYQEKQARYFVFNEKIKEIERVDAIEHACILLPDDHGIIFSNGYYLHSGEKKLFENGLDDMLFDRVIKSPNGEDYLYAFYNRRSGVYILMSYNIIAQQVDTPILCHGFTIFDDGELVYFKSEEEPQKHHALQVWQTPYAAQEQSAPEHSDSFLFKVGNADIVRGMSECFEVSTLLRKDDSYSGLYVDLVKCTGDIIDNYYWIGKPEAFNIEETLLAIKSTAQAAIEEFEKVVRIRKSTAEQMQQVEARKKKIVVDVQGTPPDHIVGFVHNLTELRTLRGEIISLRDLRYVDVARCDEMEAATEELYEKVAQQTVDFLLMPEALIPYRQAVDTQQAAIDKVTKVAAAKTIEEALDKAGQELEMLIDIVSNLKIEDSTQTTKIIDNISGIYTQLNQVKQELKKKRKSLMRSEGVAQFNAQMKLLNQAVVNYLDMSSSPEQCDEYLTKTMIQLEELEGKYSEFDEFVEELGIKRDELYNAFESRKVALQEDRNRRATKLMQSADRILKGIQNRVGGLTTVNEINGYFAADLMVDKIRDIIKQLTDLGEPLKGDDIQTRLKTIQGDGIRQLKDKQELYVDGQNIIQFGKHKFTVNTQELNLTTVQRDGDIFFHLTGTQFFETATDPTLLSTQDVWNMEVVSENNSVYRSEYLAYLLLNQLARRDGMTIEAFLHKDRAARLEFIQKYMGPRYAEGYSKGIHDNDALILLEALLEIHQSIGLLRYDSQARACALVYWRHAVEQNDTALLSSKLEAFSKMLSLFPEHHTQDAYLAELRKGIAGFAETSRLFPPELSDDAGAYLFYELVDDGAFTVSQESARLAEDFHRELVAKRQDKRFVEIRQAISQDTYAEFQVIRDWIKGYAISKNMPHEEQEYIDETAAHLLRGEIEKRNIVQVPIAKDVDGLKGSHPVIGEGGNYHLHFNHFTQKLRTFEAVTVPMYETYDKRKKDLVEAMRVELKLDEFKPRVLSAFVRNQLLDKVYLPIIGDNLAKQIGTAGVNTRTDRMGLLLLISPPGYGKTTLMEYIANRLGITFVKVNGPAIGHNVTSLDPAEAPNASAREEVEKLNLAFEMGDNVMIYLDDIQHCNPELLQKFISLCDGQRKVEGVYKGQARTYDLRGKKVAVVMAGNPYTETGGKFQIPDMLANRADTYNLGDIIGSSADAFKASYLENALTSNAALSPLSNKSRKDTFAIMEIAATGSQEGVDFEGNYSAEEINEMAAVMKKLMRVRDTILRVNLAYIRSAAQADAYRTEPAFKLQGSYRNMNRIAEKVLPIMQDSEIDELIDSHYENEAQTLTDGAEANLLKFRELEGKLSPQDEARWEAIKQRFVKNKLLGGAGETDPVNKVVAQLSEFSDGLTTIAEALASGVAKQPAPIKISQTTINQLAQALAAAQAPGEESSPSALLLSEKLEAIVQSLKHTQVAPAKKHASKKKEPPLEVVMAKETEAQLTHILEAFNRLFRHTGIDAVGPEDS